MSGGGSPVKLRRAFVMMILAAACLAVAAPHAQTPPAPQAAPTLEGYPAVGSPAVVKLLDAGAQPRKALRYNVPASYKGTMDMSMAISMNMNVGGMAVPMTLPTMKMSADLGVTGVMPNGDMSYTLAFTGVSMDGADANPAMTQALQSVQSAIQSIKGSATMSNRGMVRNAKMEMGDAGAAQQMIGELSSQLENLSTPLPEEPVGVGAKWESRQALKIAGQYSFQKAVAEVVSIDGANVTLKLSIEQTAPAQTITNPALPAGAEVQLDGSKGTGTGTSVIHLDTLVPTGETTVTSNMSMTVSMAGQSQPMTTESTIKITIAAKK